MTIRAVRWAIHGPDGDGLGLGYGLKFAVLVVMVEAANDKTLEAWPSLDTLTRLTGAYERSIRKVVAELVAWGISN